MSTWTLQGCGAHLGKWYSNILTCCQLQQRLFLWLFLLRAFTGLTQSRSLGSLPRSCRLAWQSILASWEGDTPTSWLVVNSNNHSGTGVVTLRFASCLGKVILQHLDLLSTPTTILGYPEGLHHILGSDTPLSWRCCQPSNDCSWVPPSSCFYRRLWGQEYWPSKVILLTQSKSLATISTILT